MRRRVHSLALPGWGRISRAQFVRIVMAAETGVFTLTGQDVQFMRANGMLTAEKGTFTLTGQAAAFVRALVMSAGPGAFAVAGHAAGLNRALSLAATVGGFSLSGQDIAFLRALRLVANGGAFSVAGQSAGLLASLVIVAESGAIVVGGQAASFVLGKALAADVGGFNLTGQAASFVRALNMPAAAAAFALSGQAAGLVQAKALSADTGAFSLSGQAATLGNSGNVVLTEPAAEFGGSSSFTFTGAQLGAAASSRIVVAVIGWVGNATLNSVTIGGNAATRVSILNTTASPDVGAAIAYLAVPSGTTANIVFTLSANVSVGNVSVFSVYGCTGLSDSSTAQAATGTAVAMTGVDQVLRGCEISVACSAASGNAFGWTNNTSAVERAMGGTLGRYSAAAQNLSATQSVTVSATTSGNNHKAGATAVFS